MRFRTFSVSLGAVACLSSTAQAEEIPIIGTATDATAIVQLVLDAAQSGDNDAFRDFTDSKSRLMILLGNEVSRGQEPLTLSSIAEAFQECELISLRDIGQGMVEIESNCRGKDETPSSYLFIISRKIRLFYPFQSPLLMAAPSRGAN
ncbi:MAG TPA: hypothetical protein VLA37_00025 [Sphingomonadaceae bacterium]|nr:hypothetical protein [Sphingomonadaceae bacterium]